MATMGGSRDQKVPANGVSEYVGINVNLVPGSVGSVTDSVLAMHTIEAAETAAKKDGVPHVRCR